MPDMTGVKPGDTLLLLTRYGGQQEWNQTPRPRTAYKVGPTQIRVLRVEGKPERGTDAYSRETGHSKDGFSYVTTQALYDEEREKVTLGRQLRERRVETYGEFPAATLRALLDALDDDPAPAADDSGRGIRYETWPESPDGYRTWRVVRTKGNSSNSREITGYTNERAAERVAAVLRSVAHLED